jgi:hypothetical protein
VHKTFNGHAGFVGDTYWRKLNSGTVYINTVGASASCNAIITVIETAWGGKNTAFGGGRLDNKGVGFGRVGLRNKK